MLNSEQNDEEWLSSYLPLEDMIANYPPWRMQGTIICVNLPAGRQVSLVK